MLIRLTDDDKKLFKSEIKNAGPIEVLEVSNFIENSQLFSKDKDFCFTFIGIRCEKLLKNVVNNNDWK